MTKASFGGAHLLVHEADCKVHGPQVGTVRLGEAEGHFKQVGKDI